MVKRFFQLLNREFVSVNQAALLLGFFALLSRLIALVRDRMFAHYLGAGVELDIYYAAFKIPDLLYVSFGSLVAVTVLLPFLTSYLYGNQKQEARQFLHSVFTAFLVLMVVVCTIAFFLMPKLVPLVTPGFESGAVQAVVDLARIMLLSPILLGISNLFGAVTQLLKRFMVFALSPVLYNFGILIGIIWFYPIFGLEGLALGVVVGAFLHMLIQVPVLIRSQFLPRLSRIVWQQILAVSKLSLPRTLGLSLNTIAFIALVAIASKLSTGSISIFQLSYNLQSVPLGIIGVSYAVAAFPTLAQSFIKNNFKQFAAQLSVATRQIIFWTIPVTILFIVLRAQIVRVLLGTGAFSWADTRLTAAALACFAISIVFQSLVLLFVKAYYAAGKTVRPVLINLSSTVLIVIFAFFFLTLFDVPSVRYFLESLFRIDAVAGTQVIMLPLAFSLGTMLNFFFLWLWFKRDFPHINAKTIFGRTLFESLTAGFLMGAAAYVGLMIFARTFDLHTLWGIFLQGFLAGIIGIIIGIIVLKLLHNRELHEVQQAFRNKFWRLRTSIVGPPKEEFQD